MSAHSLIELFRSRLSRQTSRRMRRSAQRINPSQLQSLESLEVRQLLTFNLAVNYSMAAGLQDVVTADFNGDGRVDIATANFSSHNVSVILGNANGTFQPAQSSPTGYNPLSAAVGDFNEDGKLDIATANGGDVSVLLGNGNGTFQAPVSIGFSDGSSPSSVAVGDFNGDGKLDLGVTSNIYYPGYGGYYGGTSPSYGGRASILLGTGGGAFAAPTSSTGYGFFTSAVLADFNGDAKDDFALVAMETYYYQGGSVQLIMGNGSGIPGSSSHISTSYTNRSVAAGDVNSDGKLDLLAVSTSQSTTSVGVYSGTGTGSFGPAQLYDAGRYSTSLTLSDFNGDSRTDILAANPDNGMVSVLLGTGTGVFRTPLTAVTGATPVAVAVGDFNGDGRVDAVSGNAGSNNVSVLLNDGAWIAVDAPSLTINDATVTEGNLGTVAATFTVTLSSASSQPVTVNYATADGSATGGSDYQSISGTLTFSPGQLSKTISVAITGDRVGETDEIFSVLLTNAANAFLPDGTGTGTIVDDEPFLSIVGEVTAVEGNTGTTPFVFTVTLSAPYDAPVTVDYSTAELTEEWIYYYGYTSATAGSDYQAKSGTLTFAAGQTSQTITVLVNGDRVGEWSEYFLVDIRNPNGARLSSVQALASIVDDEPKLRIDSGMVIEGNSGTKILSFIATLSAASDAPVTVDFATWDGSAVAGSDYLATSGTLTFAAGQTTATIPVTVKGDLLAETEEYFSMELSNPTNAGIDLAWATGAILDDDTPPSIAIYGDGIYEGNSGTKLLTFTVSLSQVSSKTVQVNYATVNGTAKTSDKDYTAKSGTLYFAPGETTKTVSVVINGDTRKEKNEYFYVKLSNATNSTIATGQATGSIWNDDGVSGGRNRLSFSSALDEDIEDILTGRTKKRRR
jgi:hypothetical protein